ncbi:MAG TPA: regulatory signaling modulator protein AmpE, partial [Gammaproteobacteria bacterium]|nr:regulatory signaling modulator protein AmpE [Gammaproteobacteria bacterium]
MTLIILLLALGLEHFVGITGEIRRFDWFYHYLNWLENRFSQYRFWNGAGGVVISLVGPLILLLLV